MVMFDPSFLAKKLNPHGLYTQVRIIPPPGAGRFQELNVPVERIEPDEDWYEFHFHGWTPGRNPKKISARVPIPFPRTKRGVFLWGDRERVIVSRCYEDLTADPGRKHWRFDRPQDVLIRELQIAFARSLRDFYFTGTPPSPSALRADVARIFTASKVCPVLPDNTVGRKSLRELVYMELPETLDLDVLKFPEELFGILDPCSTSNGEKINRVYRLCQGVTVSKQGECEPSGHDFCSTLADNAIGIDLIPNRVGTLRTAFESSLDMVDEEDPLVCGEMHSLSGVHLLTALMDLKWWTWEDCLAISESAARKMKVVRHVYEVAETFSPLELKVKEGDTIIPGGQVLGHGLSREGQRVPFLASKTRHSGWVDRITVSRTFLLGQPALRYRFLVTSHLEAKTGDKVTTRAGTKGVVKVLPDSMMPKTEDGQTVECCVSPVSVVGRKAMLALWEMMVNRRQVQKKERFVIPHTHQLRNVKPTFRQLISWGYGSKEQLWMKQDPLPEKTFVGPLYFIRLDKLAREIASVQSGRRPVNHHGIPVDSARLSGQRRDLAKTMAMSGRGLVTFLRTAIKTDSAGTDHVRKVVSVLEPQRYS